MIDFIDFVPQQIAPPGFLRKERLESLQDSLDRMRAWIQERDVEVVNVETIVLPNIHLRHEEGSEDTVIHTSGEMASGWYQFLRLWYRTG